MAEKSNRKYIDERHYTITHNKYDDNGNIVETYEKMYTDNETKDCIYITKDWINSRLKDMHVGSTFTSHYNQNYEKPVVFDDAAKKKIKGMHGEFPRGGKAKITLSFADGTKKEFVK